jgi:hypothetical protein
MNVPLLIAAAVLCLIGAMHSVLGERKGRRLVWCIIGQEVFNSADEHDVLAKQSVRLAWHLTSLAWCGTIRLFSVMFLSHSVLSLAIARGRHASWHLFLIVGVLCFAGTVPFQSVP